MEKNIIFLFNSRSGHNFIKNNIFSWVKEHELNYFELENIIPAIFDEYVKLKKIEKKDLNIIIVRDYLNWLASLLQIKKVSMLIDNQEITNERFINQLSVDIDIWCDIVKECFDESSFIKNKIIIIYDDFFSNQKYRKNICKLIGGDYNEIKLNEVLPNGNYSSFDIDQFNGNAQNMNVKKRYLDILDTEYHDIYIQLLLLKEEALSLYLKYFNVSNEQLDFINSLKDLKLKNNQITKKPNTKYEIGMYDILNFAYQNHNLENLNSNELYDIMKKNKNRWISYQNGRKISMKKMSIIPFVEISNSLGHNTNYNIADFGCGDNEFSKLRPNDRVIGLDFFKFNEDNVIECDITNTPLDDNSMDVIVLSLAIMVTNYQDILNEVYRVLKTGGILKIAEVTNKTPININVLNSSGFIDISYYEKDRFIFFDAKK